VVVGVRVGVGVGACVCVCVYVMLDEDGRDLTDTKARVAVG